MSDPSFLSSWLVSVPDKVRFPVLSKDLNVDVVVVGGGVVGVFAAWLLVKRGVSVVLLEKNHVASGDTAFTTAFVTRVPDTSSVDLVKRYGGLFVKQVYAAALEAQGVLRSVVEFEKISCDWRDCVSYYGSYVAGDRDLFSEWRVIQGADMLASFVEGVSPFAQAVKCEREARFDVRKFLFGLLSRPAGKRIKVFEETDVVDIVVGKDVVVKTEKNTITAKKVIIASGMPHSSFPELSEFVKPKVSFVLAAKFKKEVPFADELFWDCDEPYQYYRRLDKTTAILGGVDQEIGAEGSNQNPHEFLAKWLRDKFKQDFVVTNNWTGSLFETVDGLPYIAPHPKYGKKVLVATGFGGNGMVFGVLAGCLLADLAQGKKNKYAKLFDFSRTGVDKKLK